MPPVHHLAVCVTDLERSERFYCDALELPLIRRHHDVDGSVRSVWLDLGAGMFLAVERAVLVTPLRLDQAPGWHCVALGIAPADRSKWKAKLEAAGVAIERESEFTMYFRDPDGNLLGLSHYPESQPQL